jgi:signal transduction histidine kinase
MTGVLPLDWALLAVSLFNTILMLWLGLTVLLNADRRGWGVWLMGSGLLSGSAFFVSHTAILGGMLALSSQGLDFWWHVGWIPVVAAPYAWYIVTLWYTGFWTEKHSALRRRHQLWLLLASGLGLFLAVLMIAASPLPSYTQIAQFNLSSTLAVGAMPVIFIIYPIFIVLCILLSIDALLRPAPSDRLMGELARRRTRPWLIATAIMLLVVSVLVAGFVWWVASSARTDASLAIKQWAANSAIWFDLLIETLIAAAVLLVGQGIVSYEVFTGKALPRRGFFRHWRSAVILAAGYSALIGLGVAGGLRPIYTLLLTTLLMIVFYALFSWRSFVERDQFMARLRPFMGSQHLYRHLVDAHDESTQRALGLFEALCRDVLSARRAQLVPAGVLASLAGPPLVYPPGQPSVRLALPSDFFAASGSSFAAVDPEQCGGFQWALALASERGLVGFILLDIKQDGGLYTQEEIEIAQASGERLVDMLAGEEMARRLMALQRRRMAETQVADRRTRRTLHDEVLPELHAAVLSLSSLPAKDAAVQTTIQSLIDMHHQISDLIRTLPGKAPQARRDSNLLEMLHEMVDEEMSGEFTSISWQAPPRLPHLEPFVQEVVYYAVREAVRNAALHGRGGDPHWPLNLSVDVACDDEMSIAIADDGVGIGYLPQPPQTGGAGEGLALHSTMLAVIGGTLIAEPAGEHGTRVIVTLPV